MPEREIDEATARRVVRHGYDEIASNYAALASNVSDEHPRKERVRKLLARLPPRSTILELACGPGIPVAAAIVDAGHDYTGIDLSPVNIEMAKQEVPGGKFLVGDLVEHEFHPATYDAVLILYAITHVHRERWHDIFRKVHGWLKPGGVLLINLPLRHSEGWLEENFLGFGGTNWTNALAPEVSQDLLARAGFVVDDAELLADDRDDEPGWLWVSATAGPWTDHRRA